MANAKKSFKTPLAKLEYVQIDGTGKLKYDPENRLDENDPASYQYVATAVLTKEQADKVKAEVLAFWKDNKPTGATKMKYDLVKPELKKVLDAQGNEQEDEEGGIVKEETGMYLMQAKTITQWPDGKPNKIKVLRANGNPLDLGDRKIGNGSMGVIHGTLMINGFKGNEGCNFYLNAIQLKKLEVYTESDDVQTDDLGEEVGMDDVDMDIADVSKPNV
jgi:hypothetical protein